MNLRYKALLDPISETEPCGVDLEYHPDLLVLHSRTIPQLAPQYGSFTAPVESINWREIETGLLTILAKGIDIRALVLLLRCRTKLAGAEGAREGLYLITEILERYPDQVHPQRQVEGELDPGLQANTLLMLCDAETILSDFREIVVDKNTMTRLTVQDVERAFAIPHPPEVRTPESIQQQLEEATSDTWLVVKALSEAHTYLKRIAAWAQIHLQEHAPDFSPLLRLLAPFSRGVATVTDKSNHSSPDTEDEAATPPHQSPTEHAPIKQENVPVLLQEPNTANSLCYQGEDTVPEAMMTFPSVRHQISGPANRKEALALIRSARHWFEAYEPSSPVADLLRQAERLTGKSYVEIVDAIPLDLLTRWRSVDD